MTFPMQPIYEDAEGQARFRENAIVQWMVEQGRLGKKFDLNTIAGLPVPQADFVQFVQLIGYSIKGFHELSGVPDAAALAASEVALRLGLVPAGCREVGCEIHCGVPEEREDAKK